MKKLIETNKHRVFFYGTLVPLLTMLGLTYVEYRDSKQLVVDVQKAANRSIELLSRSSQNRINDQAMRHMAITHKLQCSHHQEMDELVIHYSKIIDKRDKNDRK